MRKKEIDKTHQKKNPNLIPEGMQKVLRKCLVERKRVVMKRLLKKRRKMGGLSPEEIVVRAEGRGKRLRKPPNRLDL